MGRWFTERGDVVETYRAADGWRWRVVAANGERLEQGEAHTRAADAKRAAERYHPPRPVVVGGEVEASAVAGMASAIVEAEDRDVRRRLSAREADEELRR